MRVYIETTIFNRYFEDGREYANETKLLFDKIAKEEIEAVTSLAVLEDLREPLNPKGIKCCH